MAFSIKFLSRASVDVSVVSNIYRLLVLYRMYSTQRRQPSDALKRSMSSQSMKCHDDES